MAKTYVLTALTVALLSGALAAVGTGVLKIHSKNFRHGETIPRVHTCDGKDSSPALTWNSGVKAKTFALACTDPDAPGGIFVHWIIYNIKPSVSSLSASFPKKARYGEALQGRNDFGNSGYNGPCPPPGKPHRYFFTVYALDVDIPETGLSYSDFMRKIKGHIIAESSIMGRYGRRQ